MARVRWFGTEFFATPIRQLPNGDWLMRSAEHGARFSTGTELLVRQNEIVELAAAELPPEETAKKSAEPLQAAMDAEREQLPSVQSLVEASRRPRTPEPGEA